jgi:hypothetical protein
VTVTVNELPAVVAVGAETPRVSGDEVDPVPSSEPMMRLTSGDPRPVT